MTYNRIIADKEMVRITGQNISLEEPPPIFTGNLRIGTFNIAHGRGTGRSNFSSSKARGERLSEIARFLREKKIDIAVLNEVDFDSFWSGHTNQAETIAKGGGFRDWCEQRNVDVAVPFARLRFGNAVLSRFPIVNCENVKFATYSKWEPLALGAKAGVVCDIKVSDKMVLRVFATHLDDRSEETRVKCVTNIMEHARNSPYPFIIVGDLNSSPSSFMSQEKVKRSFSAMDHLIESGMFMYSPTMAPTTEQMTFASTRPTEVIDWILIPKSWSFRSYQVHGITLSDHRPVVADVEVRRE